MALIKTRVSRVAVGIAATAVVLAGCSNGGGGTADETTLTVWTFKQSNVPGFEAAAKRFKERTGVEVQVQAFNADVAAYTTKLQSAAKTKTLPDLVAVNTGKEQQLGASGLLVDLTTSFDQAWRSELYPSVLTGSELTQAKIDASLADPKTSLKGLKAGQYFAIPYLGGTAGIVYANKSKLEAAGVDTSSAPATWEDWIAAMQKTVAADPENGGLVTGLKNPNTGLFWLFRPMSYLYMGSEKFYDRVGKNPATTWTSPASLQTFQLYNQLTPVWKPGVLSLDIDPADQAFASGKAAWDLGGTYTLPFVVDQGFKLDDLMAFPVPAPKGAAIDKLVLQNAPLVSLGVAAQSEHQKEAINFVKFITTREGASTFASAANDVSTVNLGSDGFKSNPLLGELVNQSFTGPAQERFTVNDFSKEPGAGADPSLTQSATILNKLVAKEGTPQTVAQEFQKLYAQTWAKH